jgi:hypothetical protein
MPRRFLLAVGIIWSTVASSQQVSQQACDLLTSTELAAAVGGSAGPGVGTATSYQKSARIDHDGVLYACPRQVGARKVLVKYSTSPVTPDAKKRGLAESQEMQQAIRGMGYQVQTKDVGSSHCTTVLPPGNATPSASASIGTTCVREQGPYFVSVAVGATASGDLIPMERVATLAEKAVSRLPAR